MSATPPIREQFLVISALGANPMELTNVLYRSCMDNRCAVVSSRLSRHGEYSALILQVSGNWDGLARLEGGGAWREGAVHQGATAVIQYLGVYPVALLALLQEVLRGLRPLLLVELGPEFRQLTDSRVMADDPGVLIERASQQHGQPGDQGDGQPEARQDAPEQ